MDFNATHSQCPARNGMLRRNVEDKSCNNKVELSAEAVASGPIVFLNLCCCVCRDCGLCRAHHGVHEDDGSRCLCAVCVEDIQRRKDKETAAAHMANTKHKARAPVACRQLIDGSEAAALRDRSLLPLLTVTGTVSLANLDSRVTPSLQASNQDHTEVCKQEEEVATEGERRKNPTVVHEHTESTQSYIWGAGQSRIKAHTSNLEAGRRTRSLHTAGIFPQEQICRERFCGTPFRLQ